MKTLMNVRIPQKHIKYANVYANGTCVIEWNDGIKKIKIPQHTITYACPQKDGSCELHLVEGKMDSEMFVEASKLSLNDVFMQHEPRTDKEKKFKKALENVIRQGVKDFYRQRFDPSYSLMGPFGPTGSILFKSGRELNYNYCYRWWDITSRTYMPWRNSRLGTKSDLQSRSSCSFQESHTAPVGLHSPSVPGQALPQRGSRHT